MEDAKFSRVESLAGGASSRPKYLEIDAALEQMSDVIRSLEEIVELMTGRDTNIKKIESAVSTPSPLPPLPPLKEVIASAPAAIGMMSDRIAAARNEISEILF